jgi:hypothetical protein
MPKTNYQELNQSKGKVSPGAVSGSLKQESEGSVEAALAEPREQKQDPAYSEQRRPIIKDGLRMRKCRVHRMDMNRHLLVKVQVNDRKNRRVFPQGKVVTLTERDIEALRNSVTTHRLPVGENSGIYESENPKYAAMQQNPDFDAEIDFMTGRVYLTKQTPNYVVEVLD